MNRLIGIILDTLVAQILHDSALINCFTSEDRGFTCIEHTTLIGLLIESIDIADSVSLNWKLVEKLCVILLRYSILISSVQCRTHVGFPVSSS